MSKNLYPKVIEQLRKDQDWRAIVFQIASIAPSVALKAINFVINKSEPEYMNECRRLICENLFIQAIKCYRANTCAGLKEAKDIMDKLRDDMGIKPNYPKEDYKNEY